MRNHNHARVHPIMRISQGHYAPPSLSLGPPLLSPSASPPFICGMPFIDGGGACGTAVGGGAIAVGRGIGRGDAVTVGAGKDVAVGGAVGWAVKVGATRCAACVVEALV